MRISDTTRNRTYTRDIQNRIQNLNRIQEEIGVGRSLFTPSEGVSRADQALRAKESLASDTQYLRNIADGQSWVDSADGKLQSVVDLLNDIDTLAISANNSSQTAEDRAATAIELDQKLEELVNLANARNGDRYLFGGTNTTSPPFTVVRDPAGHIQGATANPDSIAGRIYRRIDEGDDVQVNVSGEQLFQPSAAAGTDSDLFYVIATLRNTIANNNTPPVGFEATQSNEYLRTQLDLIRTRVTDQQTYIGSIGQRLQHTKSRLTAQDITLTDRLDAAQGVDTVSLATRLAGEEASYNALASIGTKLLGQSLVDYLR